MELLTATQMRAIEQAAIEGGEVTGLDLMERAGRGVVEAVFEAWPALAQGAFRALVLCGPGNNGGDGYVIARLLAEAGADVRVLGLGDAARLPPDAARARKLWPGAVGSFDRAGMIAAAEAAGRTGQAWLVVVDALFGIGQRGPLDAVTEEVGALVDHLVQARGPVPWFVAVDLPTGYDADSGAALAERPLPADLTVTFHQPKPIHGMPQFLEGELVVHDIGI